MTRKLPVFGITVVGLLGFANSGPALKFGEVGGPAQLPVQPGKPQSLDLESAPSLAELVDIYNKTFSRGIEQAHANPSPDYANQLSLLLGEEDKRKPSVGVSMNQGGDKFLIVLPGTPIGIPALVQAGVKVSMACAAAPEECIKWVSQKKLMVEGNEIKLKQLNPQANQPYVQIFPPQTAEEEPTAVIITNGYTD